MMAVWSDQQRKIAGLGTAGFTEPRVLGDLASLAAGNATKLSAVRVSFPDRCGH